MGEYLFQRFNIFPIRWAPFGNGNGLGKGSYDQGIAMIKEYLPHDLGKAWDIARENSVNPDNASGHACLLEYDPKS